MFSNPVLCCVSQLNRSDSDSAMPLYRRPSCSSGLSRPFQRNSVERRSLRWRRSPSSCSTLSVSGHSSSHHDRSQGPHITAPRTSLDLELDLRAQHTRLETLRDELSRLRMLKTQLEEARSRGDSELAAWLLEDKQFQNLIAQVWEKLLHLTATVQSDGLEFTNRVFTYSSILFCSQSRLKWGKIARM